VHLEIGVIFFLLSKQQRPIARWGLEQNGGCLYLRSIRVNKNGDGSLEKPQLAKMCHFAD
jgi:hypothetical protein